MSTKIFTAIITTLLLFSVEARCADPVTASVSIPQATERLKKATIFAFGGVGFAGTMSDEETAFHVICSSTDASALFSTIYSQGTDEAKLYALSGLHRLDKGSFDALAKALDEKNPKVMTMSGCLVIPRDAADVVAGIDAGTYDSLVGKPAR